MRKLFYPVTFLLFNFSAFNYLYGAEVKIGYIDSNRILSEYRGKTTLKDALDTKLKTWESEVTKKKQAIIDATKNFETQGPMLTPSAQERKKQELQTMQDDYETFVQKIWGTDGEAKHANDEIMKPFIDKVNLILQKIGEDQGFTIIFDAASTGIVYTKSGMDLTDIVVQELNQEFAPIVQNQKAATYFWVFKFKETSGAATEHQEGNEIAGYVSVAFTKFTGVQVAKSDKMKQAMSQISLNKKEEYFTDIEAAQIGKLGGADFVVTGQVSRMGEIISVTCKTIDTQTNMELANETGKTQRAEPTDITTMVGEMVSKLVKNMPGISSGIATPAQDTTSMPK